MKLAKIFAEGLDLSLDDWRLLGNYANEIEADMIEVRLKEDDIPILRRYSGADQYLKIIARATLGGVDVYVPAVSWQKAKSILQQPAQEFNISRKKGLRFKQKRPRQ